MQTIARFSFAVAAVLMATATVTTATPALAKTVPTAGRSAAIAATPVLVSSKAGDSAGPRRYCLSRGDTGQPIGCRTARAWGRQGVTIRVR